MDPKLTRLELCNVQCLACLLPPSCLHAIYIYIYICLCVCVFSILNYDALDFTMWPVFEHTLQRKTSFMKNSFFRFSFRAIPYFFLMNL